MKLVEPEYYQKKVFKPFNITLRIETGGDARLLWHVFNRGNLKGAIFTKEYPGKYQTCVTSSQFCGGIESEEIRAFIQSKIVGDI